jgi:hypothetical protein
VNFGAERPQQIADMKITLTTGVARCTLFDDTF